MYRIISSSSFTRYNSTYYPLLKACFESMTSFGVSGHHWQRSFAKSSWKWVLLRTSICFAIESCAVAGNWIFAKTIGSIGGKWRNASPIASSGRSIPTSRSIFSIASESKEFGSRLYSVKSRYSQPMIAKHTESMQMSFIDLAPNKLRFPNYTVTKHESLLTSSTILHNSLLQGQEHSIPCPVFLKIP